MQPIEVWRLKQAERSVELRDKERVTRQSQQNADRMERQELHKHRRETALQQEQQRKMEAIQKKISLSARLRVQHQRVSHSHQHASGASPRIASSTATAEPAASSVALSRSRYERLMGMKQAAVLHAGAAVHRNPNQFTDDVMSKVCASSETLSTVIPSTLSSLSRPPVQWQL